MVEFAIASAVLALLMLGMPLVARLHELQLTGIEATRVAAIQRLMERAAAEKPHLVEMADRVLINKADGDNRIRAQQARIEQHLQHLRPAARRRSASACI